MEQRRGARAGPLPYGHGSVWLDTVVPVANVLVIGGTLFIGRALVRRLLARGDRVTILHRGEGTPFGSQVEEIRCDRNDTESTAQAISSRPFEL